MEIKRDVYLNRLINRRKNSFIKVITGIRRSGKSYLLNNLFYDYLIHDGVDDKHIIKFSFDSAEDLDKIGENFEELERKKQKVSHKKFLNYVNSLIIDKKDYYLLLDEVQRLESFEAVLNGYLLKRNIDVYVTGSNSKFLSSDIITEFAGRGDEVHILPLSFSEFYPVCKNMSKDEAFEEYLVYGGLPACALMKTDEQKSNYLKTQIKNVYFKDIVDRYKLSGDENINELLNIIASGISGLVNPSKLFKSFHSIKPSSTISEFTINKYIDHMIEAFIISKALRYDVKGKRYISTPYKLYFEDVGLRNAQLDFRQIENTHLMENVIYNELRYRGYSIDVGSVEIRKGDNKTQYEVDFVCNLGSKRIYIQSAYRIDSLEKENQEMKSLDNINDSFKKVVIVSDNIKARYNDKGYLIMGVKDFLLNPDSVNK